MPELRLVDTTNVADLLERYPELRIPTARPAMEARPIAELAEIYARQADELARIVEDADRKYRATVWVVLNGLAELHVALDEIAHRAAEAGWPS